MKPAYLDYSDRADLVSGGVRVIPISTPQGSFIWEVDSGAIG